MSADPRGVGADLHVHSNRSDGSDPPAHVVERAARAGLAAFALTDHDTTDGLDEAFEAGRRLGVEVIPGVELSTSFEGHEVHLLGYFFRPGDGALQEAFAWMVAERERRLEKMVARLNQQGIPLTVAGVRSFAGGRSVGRPHVADALVRGGYVSSHETAWQDYLGAGGKAWVEREKIPLQKGIDLVRAAGGVTAIAHPTINVDRAALEKISTLGVHALETTHPDVGEADAAFLSDLCRRRGLIESGGSDCHGARRRGPILGNYRVPQETVDALRALAGTSS